MAGEAAIPRGRVGGVLRFGVLIDPPESRCHPAEGGTEDGPRPRRTRNRRRPGPRPRPRPDPGRPLPPYQAASVGTPPPGGAGTSPEPAPETKQKGPTAGRTPKAWWRRRELNPLPKPSPLQLPRASPLYLSRRRPLPGSADLAPSSVDFAVKDLEPGSVTLSGFGDALSQPYRTGLEGRAASIRPRKRSCCSQLLFCRF